MHRRSPAARDHANGATLWPEVIFHHQKAIGFCRPRHVSGRSGEWTLSASIKCVTPEAALNAAEVPRQVSR